MSTKIMQPYVSSRYRSWSSDTFDLSPWPDPTASRARSQRSARDGGASAVAQAWSTASRTRRAIETRPVPGARRRRRSACSGSSEICVRFNASMISGGQGDENFVRIRRASDMWEYWVVWRSRRARILRPSRRRPWRARPASEGPSQARLRGAGVDPGDRTAPDRRGATRPSPATCAGSRRGCRRRRSSGRAGSIVMCSSGSILRDQADPGSAPSSTTLDRARPTTADPERGPRRHEHLHR